MDLIGRVLGGRYRIVRGIGAGGMGGVYEATQEGLGRRVAVKVIAQQLAAEPLYLERFRREAMTAAQLGHPNLVTVTDFQHVPGEPPFLVMEMLEGEPLNTRLSRGPMEPALAVDVTLQILAGLEAAHAQGIVHRDLKPGNVFLVPLPAGRWLVKVLDFGIAKLMDSATFSRLTQTGVLVGTPRYAAPEQLKDSKSVDPRTDLYAVGALLYCMLTGRPPYRSSSAQLLVDITDKEPTDPRIVVAGLDPGLVAVVRRAMAKARDQRFSDAREFAGALGPFAGLTSAPTPAASPPMRVEPSSAPASAATYVPPRRAVAATAPLSAPPTPTSMPPAPMPSPTSYPPTPTPPVRRTPTPVPRRSREPAPRPTPAPPPRRVSMALGIALGVLIGGVVLAVGVGGVWLGMHEAELAGETPAARPTVPARGPREPDPRCLEWERLVCDCSDPDVAAQWCAYARNVNDSIRRGEAGQWNCVLLLDSMRQSCPTRQVPAQPPQPLVARPATGIPACDELTQFACSCGPPGLRRNERCARANTLATDVVNGTGSDEWNQASCTAEQSRLRRACDAQP